jgi:hypothetical protein
MFFLRNIGIHSSHENTIYIRDDSPLMHSEGFKVLTEFLYILTVQKSSQHLILFIQIF